MEMIKWRKQEGLVKLSEDNWSQIDSFITTTPSAIFPISCSVFVSLCFPFLQLKRKILSCSSSVSLSDRFLELRFRHKRKLGGGVGVYGGKMGGGGVESVCYGWILLLGVIDKCERKWKRIKTQVRPFCPFSFSIQAILYVGSQT